MLFTSYQFQERRHLDNVIFRVRLLLLRNVWRCSSLAAYVLHLYRLPPLTRPRGTSEESEFSDLKEKILFALGYIFCAAESLLSNPGSSIHIPGVAAGYRERLLAKNFESFYLHRGRKFLRTISPYNLPDRPVYPTISCLELPKAQEQDISED